MPAHNLQYLVASHPYPHIGQLLEKRMVESRLRQSEVAKRMGINPSAVARYFGQGSVQVGILWKMGLALGRNLPAEVAEAFPIAPAADTDTGGALAQAQARIADLEKELAIYKSIVLAGKGR